MNELAPQFSVKRLEECREVHYALSGLFTEELIPQIFKSLYETSLPFIEDRGGFRVLGDLRDFVVQPQEISPYMQRSQDDSAKVGVDRMAIVYSSALVKLQFTRVSAALDLGTFTEPDEALAWLRSK